MIDISVIIPVFHVEKYIGKCINSLIEQSYRDFEIILVDDGNDDNLYGVEVPDYIDTNVSLKIVKIIQSYTNIVNKMVWRK